MVKGVLQCRFINLLPAHVINPIVKITRNHSDPGLISGWQNATPLKGIALGVGEIALKQVEIFQLAKRELANRENAHKPSGGAPKYPQWCNHNPVLVTVASYDDPS